MAPLGALLRAPDGRAWRHPTTKQPIACRRLPFHRSKGRLHRRPALSVANIGDGQEFSSMGTAIDEQVRSILADIDAPAPYGSLTGAARLSGLSVNGKTVSVALEVDSADTARALESARAEAQTRIATLDGVDKAMVLLTADARQDDGSPCRPQDPTPRPRQQPRPQGGTTMQPSRPPAQGAGPAGRQALAPSVRYIIAVASGKGGVGKSTTSANLALALSQLGYRVGILDADIYGPSLPRMMGVEGKPETKDGKTLEPMSAHGVAMMSIGLLVEEDRAMIWRGPMVQ